MKDKLYSIDGLFWWVDQYNEIAIPVCPVNTFEMRYDDGGDDIWSLDKSYITELHCQDCGITYKLRRNLRNEEKYVISKVRAIDYQNYKVIDIDGILTPVTKKQRVQTEDGYFCTAQIRDSKRGPQVVIYAGKKGSKEKSQIFITPEERRLSFDQNDLNPADVFTKITAEFKDGDKHIIEGKNEDNQN